MTTQAEKATAFKALHVKGDPVVLYNVWDAGSAKAVAAAGAKALATASWAVAAAHGFEDGEKLPRDLALANMARIAAVTDLPVTMDIEAGYGKTPEAVADTVAKGIAAGAIGFNIEDGALDGPELLDAHDYAERLRAARAAADAAGVPVFLNARTDGFIKERDFAKHDRAMIEDALRRAAIYAEAGADGLFVPRLADEDLIRDLCARSPLPVNIGGGGAGPRSKLAALGVARISHGPGGYLAAMASLSESAKAYFAS